MDMSSMLPILQSFITPDIVNGIGEAIGQKLEKMGYTQFHADYTDGDAEYQNAEFTPTELAKLLLEIMYMEMVGQPTNIQPTDSDNAPFNFFAPIKL